MQAYRPTISLLFIFLKFISSWFTLLVMVQSKIEPSCIKCYNQNHAFGDSDFYVTVPWLNSILMLMLLYFLLMTAFTTAYNTQFIIVHVISPIIEPWVTFNPQIICHFTFYTGTEKPIWGLCPKYNDFNQAHTQLSTSINPHKMTQSEIPLDMSVLRCTLFYCAIHVFHNNSLSGNIPLRSS